MMSLLNLKRTTRARPPGMKFVELFILSLVALLAFSMVVTPVKADTLQVPQSYSTIQAAVNAAKNGDIVLVSPGIYRENVAISGRTIVLASEYYSTGDPSFIDRTIIEPSSGTAVKVNSTAPDTEVNGFTIRNTTHGIDVNTRAKILNNKVNNTTDGISFTNGSGLIKGNVLENNLDDGIDIDRGSSGTIEDNVIRNNQNDGIEIRLHDYTGPRLNIIIQCNQLYGNLEDGIQLIDYPSVTDRVFTIGRNLIYANRDAGLGIMSDGVTGEDFRGAQIPERVYVYNNTFSGNSHAMTGGGNLIALNNMFINSSVLGIKNTSGGAIAAYNLFWANATDYENSNVDFATTLFTDPMLDANYQLLEGSQAIDTGTGHYEYNGEVVLDYPSDTYNGNAPDLGWKESNFSTGTPTQTPTTDPNVTPTETPKPTITPSPTPVPLTLRFIPTDDTMVSSGAPKKKFGSVTELLADNSPTKIIYFKFSVTGINGRQISGVKLRLYNTNSSDKGGDIRQTLVSTWSESTVNWNTRPSAGFTVYASLGNVAANTWVELDLGSLIVGDGIYSIELITSSSNVVGYNSKEAASNIPELLITLNQ